MIPQYKPLINRESLAKEINDYVLGDGYFMEYKKTQEFEKKLAEYLNVKYCSCVPNGTIALSLALIASGVEAGSYVLIPNITMMSTQVAVELIGAKPLFIDVDDTNLCMDLNQAEWEIQRSTSKLSAIIYVTLNGRSHNVERLNQFKKTCNQNDVAFIEDNAQAFGSCYDNNNKISSFDDNIGCFSLSVAKSITTGQGGFMVTNNDELGGRIKRIKDLGRENGGHDLHDEFGINAKFTEIQAIMGLNQLRDIEKIINKKKEIYDIYYNELKDIPNVKIFKRKDHESIWFVDIYVSDREELKEFLYTNNVGTRQIYPALTTQEINEKDFYESKTPISIEYAKKGLWLASSLDLIEPQIKDICIKIKNFLNHKQILSNMRNE